MKKIKKLLFFFTITWILCSLYLTFSKNIPDKLKEKGYPMSDILELKSLLHNESLNILLNYNYHQNILNLIQEKNFKEENLEKYLIFFFKHNSADNYDIIYLVNHFQDSITYNSDIHEILHSPDFKEYNFNRYIKFYQDYELKGDATVMAVNQNLDQENVTIDDTILLFLGKKYSITQNLERYKDYYKKHKELGIEEIIKRVNCNLDSSFYKKVMEVDFSKQELIIVNKFYKLKENYVPNNLVSIDPNLGDGKLKEIAYLSFLEMEEEAQKNNLYFYISSPYRSFKRQQELYQNYAKKDGTKKADTYSARPGYSEHQTGLAIDLGTKKNHNINDFEKSKEFKWIKENAHHYGFILRYPLGKEYITGYQYEPWHFRYVGVEAATYIYENDITFEEYYEFYVK